MLNYIEELKKLHLPEGQYAIFGSGPLAIRNIRASHDIDIIVTKKLWKKLIEKYNTKIQSDPVSIKIGNIEIFYNWMELTDKIEEMINTAEIINELPFVQLKYVLEWKESMGREKDKKDIELINKYLEKEKIKKVF
ncbi:MAG: hypothetical protein US52_C0060G0006 [candidate division WS6 bacterium GW2011_GWA2_37_6]|uniref:Uncharacterized protein n=1 Tax=candidate division WS6 bacterium GW2011_GWA2_37_6 TaxID=1619087 RepID=A0A0G0GWG6_9BACT|nr:MAG: hypothetical protein US52_C0060G0006 [candidate division WS6 bacterium GW2011_GWA2_37_6]